LHQEQGNEMMVLDVCDPEFAAMSPESSVADAVQRMLELRAGAVVVVDSEKRVAGIFTERDVLSKVVLSGRAPAAIPLKDVMTTPVEMATEATTVSEALKVMLERHYRHLPVIDQDGRVLGVLSIRHVLHAYCDELTEELHELERRGSSHRTGG